MRIVEGGGHQAVAVFRFTEARPTLNRAARLIYDQIDGLLEQCGPATREMILLNLCSAEESRQREGS